MMAYTNKDVNELNQGAREQENAWRTQRPGIYLLDRERGTTFSSGDRIIFLRNEHSIGVRNGTLGTVERINRESMAVRLDSGHKVAIDTHMYRDFDHGYAATVHKTQGSTLDNTYVLGSRHFDKHTAYVAMSRHRDNVTMYYGKDEFRNFEDLQRVMSREQAKGLIVDYGIPRGVEIDDRLIKAERVRSYEEIKQDAEQRIEAKKSELYLSYQDRFYTRIEQKLHERAQEEYRQKQQERGINVEFVKDYKQVEGYYSNARDIDGRRYAVIETHGDLTKGTSYMVPYDKKYDEMHMHRYVVYDGWEMKEVNKRLLDKERQLARDQEEKRQLVHDRELSPSESKYCQLMQDQGLQVAFINEKTVEGYFTRIEDLGENKYAVIETKHGIECMVPYDKQYDNMQTQRYVQYDGHQMSPAVDKNIERDLNQGKGLGLER